VNRKIISLVAAFLVTIPSMTAVAQTPSAASKAAPRAVGPTVAASAVGIRAPAAEKSNAKAAAAADAHLGAGQNVALMVVGGAAIVIGAIIGGAGGVLLAVAGAAVGLYGLYNFVQ
jgi:hypothetical protein